MEKRFLGVHKAGFRIDSSFESGIPVGGGGVCFANAIFLRIIPKTCMELKKRKTNKTDKKDSIPVGYVPTAP